MRAAYAQNVAYLSGDFLATSNQEASELLMTVVEVGDTARLVNKAGLTFSVPTEGLGEWNNHSPSPSTKGGTFQIRPVFRWHQLSVSMHIHGHSGLWFIKGGGGGGYVLIKTVTSFGSVHKH